MAAPAMAAAAAQAASQTASRAADTTAAAVRRVQGGVGGQIFFLAFLLFAAWIYASGRTLAVLDAIRSSPDLPATGDRATPGRRGGRDTPTSGRRGPLGDSIRRAEEDRRRREDPNATVLDDTPVPGSPGGAWTPRDLKWGKFL